jgi:Ribbon-helix-helix protein, copG family
MAKKKATRVASAKPDITNWTKPRQFRLTDDTMELLDQLCVELEGISRTDALRIAIKEACVSRGIKKKSAIT